MRVTGAIAGALLLTGALSVSGQAAEPAGPAPMARPPQLCDAPVANPGARPHRRIVHHYVRVRRRWAPRVVAMLPPPPPLIVYNNWVPSPYIPGYDRGMVMHYQSPPVSGIYGEKSGMAPLPPVPAYQPYRVTTQGGVFQLDGLTGQYVRLAPNDAARVLAGGPLPVFEEEKKTE